MGDTVAPFGWDGSFLSAPRRLAGRCIAGHCSLFIFFATPARQTVALRLRVRGTVRAALSAISMVRAFRYHIINIIGDVIARFRHRRAAHRNITRTRARQVRGSITFSVRSSFTDNV